jgi:hypothetical protein
MKKITIGMLKPSHLVITMLAKKVREADKEFYCDKETTIQNLNLILNSEGSLASHLKKVGIKDSSKNISLASAARKIYRDIKKQLGNCNWILQSAVQKLA